MMMKTIYILSLSLIVFLISNSCTEKIDIKLDETYTRLVVEGGLTTDTMIHSIYLSKTAPYFSNEAAPKISGAHVYLNDDEGHQIVFEELESGIYQTQEETFGISGKTYEMTIELAEEISDNKVYHATSTIPYLDPIDSIGLVFDPGFGREGYWIIQLYAQDPVNVANFYMFNVYKNGILMTDTLDKVSFTDDKLFDGSYTNGIGVVYFNNAKENERFEIGDSVTLVVSGITQEHYTFMNDVIRSTSFQNPMFGGPPANVIGNIDKGAFGYFATFSSTHASLIVSEENTIGNEY